jgi:Zn-dependent protease with chaperone function
MRTPARDWEWTATKKILRLFLPRVATLGLALLLLLDAATLRCRAQDTDDHNGYTAPRPFALLALSFDSHGGVEVNLNLDAPPKDWHPIQAALGTVLHCSPDSFSNPAPNDYEFRILRRTPAQRHDQVREMLSATRLRQLRGHCSNTLATDGWVVGGDLPLQPLALVLAREGKQTFIVNVSRPAGAFEEHSTAQCSRFAASPNSLAYNYRLSENAAVGNLHLAYGFRRSDLIRQSAISLGFLLLPLIITLWMRRAALKDAAEDPTAAWFSYFKTLQWCVNGTMLLWMVARTSVRQGLENLIAFRLGDVAWQAALAKAAVTMIPPWFVYLLCLAFSYEVFVQVRGNRWKRHEFLLNQVCTLGAQFFPLMFVFSGFDFLWVAPKIAILLFGAAYFSRVLCLRGAAAISGSAPEALTTGELRDRIFQLAAKAGVKIKQVFVLSAGKSQVANAFAAKSSIVIFTDYLLKRMSKREVDAITGHELTHLRLGHPRKLGFTLLAAVLAPTLFRACWSMASTFLIGSLSAIAGPDKSDVVHQLKFADWLEQLPQLDLVLVAIGFAIFYLRARLFERAADAGSVQLVGDPEAMISGLLKISRLNLMPIQWGKITGSILTHPSTLKRVEHIAQIGNVPPERLQQILAEHELEQKAWRAASREDFVAVPGEHYAVPETASQVLSTMGAARRATSNLWILIAAHVLPPALIVLLVNKAHLAGWPAVSAYFVGCIACVGTYSIFTAMLGLRGRKQIRKAFLRKFESEGIAVRGGNAVLTGFSPSATPRFFVAGYNWDTGFLVLLRDRMIFLGDRIRFALKFDQMGVIRLGPAGPGWWTRHRVYLDWRDPGTGREGTFNLLPHEPVSIGKFNDEAKDLLQRLQDLRANPNSFPEAPASMLTLAPPVLGEVTSHSPKEILSGAKMNAMTVLILGVGYGVTTLLSISPWYVFCVIGLIRIYERIPYWRYRELDAPAMRAAIAVARAQAGSGH